MRIPSRFLAGALAALVIGSVAAPAFAQEATPGTSLSGQPTTRAALFALPTGTAPRQLSAVTITSVALPNDMTPAESATWPSGLNLVLTVLSNDPICPPAQPGMATCMAFGNKAYQIRIAGNTAINQKDQTPLQGEGLEIGDRINAYGAFDGQVMDAQIVRDLDKPFSTQPVQLDGLRVISIEQGKDGIQIGAVRGTGPCWNYAGSMRLAYPCPPGSQPSPTVRTTLETSGMPLGVATYYSIALPRGARVLANDRTPIAASAVRVGDTINVYGTYVTEGMLRADILRITAAATAAELRIGVVSGAAALETGDRMKVELRAEGGVAPYAWSVDRLPSGVKLEIAPTIYCVTTPCPQGDTARASLTGSPITAGTTDVEIQVRDAAGAASYLRFPITVTGEDIVQDVQVTVDTDRDAYRADQVVEIEVTATNTTDEVQEIDLSNGCHADYDVLPGFSLRAVQLCALIVGTLTLEPGESQTYAFEHDLAQHPMPKMAFPFDLTVVGRVQNVGEASKTIEIRAAR